MKKLVSLVIVMALVLSLAVGAAAQTVAGSSSDGAKITISNAAKGETYNVYKVFDATVTGTQGGSIAYSYDGTLPDNLKDVFSVDTAGNVSVIENKTNNDVITALKAWADAQSDPNATAVSDGTALEFTGLDYGYYVVTSTQNSGSAITVTSTNPSATIVDKNTTAPGSNLTKTVDDNDVFIGQEVNYTVSFKTANYKTETATDGTVTTTQIVSYTLKDTLPDFLSNVTVTDIIVDEDGDASTTESQKALEVKQFDAINKTITIDWVDSNNNSLYKNGSVIIIKYKATVSDKAAIDGNGNTNTASVSWKLNNNTIVDGSPVTSTIYTYAIALKKVDQGGKALANATFQFPFYVKATADADGAYIYAGSSAGEGLTNTLTTPATDGVIIVKGVQSGDYSITETAAPDGYNKLTAPVNATAVQTNATTTSYTTYLDASGNETENTNDTSVTYDNNKISTSVTLVVNKTGTELPSTGGVGTTIFYALGSLMFVGALVLLVTNKRMKAE